MFMQILIEGIALQIGIQLAQSAFDRCSHGTKAFPYEPDFILEPQIAVSTESAILVLVVSAVVLTVALGLVTCVLSHYRGGTAADPHDAGHTPTTAP
ncbi:uncharacterized protein LOC116173479 isoform X2 [Photinus pyralis]|uniref:uncharacterized protein LOC116173479 isoform X2 n=1 Tax=Photinus pyralis TaxID=7054 RepID=UPI00126724D9|nr:uncharacterized protein LOC116173479 isoform X2 [Photinus pyralis]